MLWILTAWQNMKLIKAMSEIPNESKVAVYRTFSTQMMSLQKQLDFQYHRDRFICERFLTAAGITSIQANILDLPSRSSHQAVKRIAHHLFDKASSAGSQRTSTNSRKPWMRMRSHTDCLERPSKVMQEGPPSYRGEDVEDVTAKAEEVNYKEEVTARGSALYV